MHVRIFHTIDYNIRQLILISKQQNGINLKERVPWYKYSLVWLSVHGLHGKILNFSLLIITFINEFMNGRRINE